MWFTLNIEAEGSYAFAWTGWPPGSNEKSEGSVKMVNSWLTLTPNKQRIPLGFPSTPTRFLPVRWGARTYLLTKDEIVDFCNSINHGTEPRNSASGSFCLRMSDWSVSVEGSPSLPTEWAAYLLKKPLQAEVIGMADERTGKLNVGAKDGVRPGMVLDAGQGKRFPCLVRVVAVDNDTSTIRELNGLIVPDIKIGDRVGSKLSPEPQKPYGVPANPMPAPRS
jgi:hypothetical protein